MLWKPGISSSLMGHLAQHRLTGDGGGLLYPKGEGNYKECHGGWGGGGKILKSEVLARLMYRSCLLSAVTVLSVHLESSAKRTFFTTVSTLNHYVIVRHLCVFFSLYWNKHFSKKKNIEPCCCFLQRKWCTHATSISLWCRSVCVLWTVQKGKFNHLVTTFYLVAEVHN